MDLWLKFYQNGVYHLFTLYAVMCKRDQQPTKIHRCLDALKQYFSQLPGGRVLPRRIIISLCLYFE